MPLRLIRSVNVSAGIKYSKLKLISEKKQHFSKKGGTFAFVYDT